MESPTIKYVKIVNISDYSLNADEIDILRNGLKFTPTPKNSDHQKLNLDVTEFCRNLRLKEYFHESTHVNNSLVKNRSSFVPPKNRNEALNNFINMIENYPLHNKCENKSYNITLNERRAISSLAENKSIIIKQADKGGAVTIMNAKHYKEMCENTINDPDSFRQFENYSGVTHFNKYKKFISKYACIFNKHEMDYLSKFDYSSSNLYGLPKLHKSNKIKEICEKTNSDYVHILNVNDLKVRPVIAGPKSVTNRLSQILHILLQPYVEKINHLVRDSMDFLNKLPASMDADNFFVTFDVINLYPSIPHDYGLTAITYWLEKYPELLPPRFNKIIIIESIRFILENNIFHFNNCHYIQNKGTAIGTDFAPDYANLTMGYFEIELFISIKNNFESSVSDYVIKFWNRFLDDIFSSWNDSLDNLKKLFSLMNNINNNFKFTMNYSKNSIPYLDIMISKNHYNTISTDIYYKPTDGKNYLPFKSHHAKHVKINVPFNLAKRLRTIISDNNTLNIRLKELRNTLVNLKYPTNVIDNGLNKALSLNRNDLLKPIVKDKKSLIPFISTYNRQNFDIYQKVRLFQDILVNDDRMKAVLKKNPIIKCYRQPPNLKNILCKAKFSENTNINGVTRCGKSRCLLCQIIIIGEYFTFKNGRKFTIKSKMNCDTLNVIYALKCEKCGAGYIGETSNLRKRVNLHRNQNKKRKYRKLFVNKHISQCSNFNFKVMPLYKLRNDNAQERKIRELYFIRKFAPLLNRDN